ncbi:MAG: hypothetical protein O7H41_00700 [Planctomycetota bacterium]|nr:hypothetical protein [Planctomycetota bacterium]
MARLSRYLIIFIWGLCHPRAALVTTTLAMQSHLAACLEQIEKKEARRLQFDAALCRLCVFISKVMDDWQDCWTLRGRSFIMRMELVGWTTRSVRPSFPDVGTP